MKAIRSALITLCTLPAVGYFASQWYVFHGEAAQYHAKVDQPSVSALAWVVVAASVALGFMSKTLHPERESE